MSRILIDCTYVFEHPQDNSGIQRVVRNVVDELARLRPQYDVRAVKFGDEGLLEVLSLQPRWGERLLERLRLFASRAAASAGRAAQRLGCYIGLGPATRLRMQYVASGIVFLATYITQISRLIGPADLEQMRLRRLRHRAGDQLVLLDSSWHYDLLLLERLKQAGVEMVPVIHDLVPLSHPQFCVDDLVRVFAGWFERTSALASGYLSISRATEDTLKAHLRNIRGADYLDTVWFEHFHHGARLDRAAQGEPDPDIRAAFDAGEPVYLAVGTVEPRKNHAYALTAFEQLWAQGAQVRLCLIGKAGWKSDRLMERILTHPELNSRLFMFNQANDASLAYAYRQARTLVFPSHHEGFGLPMIEAMQGGLPVMASDIPIFREVGGDFVAYFDLTDPQSLAALVKRFEDEGTFPATDDVSDWRWHGWTEATHQIVSKVASHTNHGAAMAEPAPRQGRVRHKLTRFQYALGRADRFRDRKDWPAAASAYRKALRIEPGQAAIWVQHGHAVKESGRPLDAVRSYRQATVLDPSSADAALQLGHCLSLVGQRREAAAQYLVAMRLDSSLADAGTALGSQGRVNYPPDELLRALGEPSPGQGEIYLELLDAIEFFRSGRRPTGIQRVQLELANACLDECETGRHRLCFFVRERAAFVELPQGLVRELYDATRIEGDATAAIRQISGKIRFYGDNAPLLEFPQGATLVSLGPVWTAKGFLGAVQRCKRQADFSYATLMHDLIPLKMPLHCDEGTVGNYHTWLTEALEVCDFFLANSESTKRDLLETAAFLRVPLSPSLVTVVRLDADSTGPMHPEPDRVLSRLGINREFVLMVGTLEPRKNHVAAFEAWNQIAKSSPAKVPLLVCVGKWGWKSDDIVEGLSKLEGRAMVISGLSDKELSVLYRRALFTLFPSLYEGWGLPVTESLCHGTPVLAALNSSLPEAGGAFAIYFDAGDPADLAAKVLDLLDDRSRLQGLRQTIQSGFRARSWNSLLEDLDRAVVGTLVDA